MRALIAGAPWRGAMTALDRRCILALEAIQLGPATRAAAVSAALHMRMTKGQPITTRERHALYAIAYRFRGQLPAELLAEVTSSLAGAAAAVALLRMERSADYPQARQPRPAIRAVRNLGARPTPPANPLDGIFSQTGACS